MIIRVICRCGVVLVGPHGEEGCRVALDTALPLKCPHCGEKTTIEIRKRQEEAAKPAAACGRDGESGEGRGTDKESR